MSDTNSKSGSTFDVFARGYDNALAEGLSATGENRDYFARRRIEWLKRCLDRLAIPMSATIEFGCGTGSNIPFLTELLGATSVAGIDASAKSLDVARSAFASPGVRFFHSGDYTPDGTVDLVFCNGVFHHIPPDDRGGALKYIFDCLRPTGMLALWENNPWNPGTRYVMSRIAFDEGAVTLNPLEARRLVRAQGFEIIRTDFLFIFPRMMKWLRWTEPPLSRLPIGGQYELLCRKPTSTS